MELQLALTDTGVKITDELLETLAGRQLPPIGAVLGAPPAAVRVVRLSTVPAGLSTVPAGCRRGRASRPAAVPGLRSDGTDTSSVEAAAAQGPDDGLAGSLSWAVRGRACLRCGVLERNGVADRVVGG